MYRKKALVFGLTALGTGLVIRKLWTLMDIGDKVSFVISSLKVQKVIAPKNVLDVAGYKAQIRVGIRIYNPSKQTINLQIPSVKVLYRGNEIAYSMPDTVVTTISPLSASEKTLSIDVPLYALTNIGIMNDLLANTDKLSEVLAKNLTFAIIATVNGVTMTTQQSLAGTGLALSAGPRTVKDGSRFNKYFPQTDNSRKTVKRNGEVNDVVEMAIRIVRDHHQEAAQIAQVLKGKTIRETASNLFNFAYDYLQYRRDSVGREELRTPARSWHDGQVRHKQMGIDSSGIDCDDYSIFCGSVLQCLGIPFRFRITKYNGRDYYQHIYVYIPGSDGSPDIIIDPVLDRFDYEKPYSEQKDNFNMASLYAVEGLNGMPIEMLSGIEGFDGLGEMTNDQLLDKTYNYILQTRNAVAANPAVMKNFTGDVNSLIAMFDDAIKYWHTPLRDQVLDRLAMYEDALERSGVFKPVQGLNGELQGGFFKKVGKLAKSVAKQAISVAKVAAPAVAALTASNPFTAAIAPIAIKAASTLTTKAKSAPKVAKVVDTVQAKASSVTNFSNELPVSPLPLVNNAIKSINSKASAAPSVPYTKSATIAQYAAPTIPAKSSAIATQALPSTPTEEYYQNLVPATTPSLTPTNNVTMSDTTNTTEQRGSFLSRNKKPLLIVGGALLLGTAAVVLLRPSKKDTARPYVAARTEQKALGALPGRRRRKKAKPKKDKPAKRHNPKNTKSKTRRGVRKVTLR